MRLEDISIGDEVRNKSAGDNWLRVNYMEGDLLVGRIVGYDIPDSWWACDVIEMRPAVRPIGYQWVGDQSYTFDSAKFACTGAAIASVRYIVTHWSDGTCTLDTIDAFGEAHK